MTAEVAADLGSGGWLIWSFGRLPVAGYFDHVLDEGFSCVSWPRSPSPPSCHRDMSAPEGLMATESATRPERNLADARLRAISR